MKPLALCFLIVGSAVAAEPQWTEITKKTTVDARTGVKQELYQYIDDNSFERAGELIVANVRTVTETTYPSGEWIESVVVTQTGFNCIQRRQGPLHPPLSGHVVRHNVDGTVTDLTAATKAQFAAMPIGLNQHSGPEDKGFAHACSRK